LVVLPFSREQFLAVFAQYNAAIWPLQVVAALLGIAIVVALLWRSARAERWVLAGLALMWLWTGVAYHGVFFSRINPVAFAFAPLFVAQAMLLAYAAWAAGVDARSRARGTRAWLGWALVAYAGLLYPLVGALTGHTYPAAPVFGVTPCPVTLFTLGVLLLGPQPVARQLLAIPALWALIGGSAAFLLDVAQDWPLLVGGVAATALLLWVGRSRRAAGAPA
jgi:hypothetical protein